MLRSPPFIDLGIIIDGLQSSLIGPKVTLTGTEEVVKALNSYATHFGNPERFLSVAARTYRDYMVENYLTGQRLRRRSGRLVNAWQPQRLSEHEYLVSPGMLPYARVHEYGIYYPFQPVRGYTTRAGRKVRMYFRDMKLSARHYIRDTIFGADPLVMKRLTVVATHLTTEAKSGEQLAFGVGTFGRF